MSANNPLLDFTSPGAIPPDPTEIVGEIINKTQAAIRTLETLLETERIEDVAGWKLLAMFYLATDRINDLAKIEEQYKSISGVSLCAGLKQKYTRWLNGNITDDLVVFKIPAKITAVTLPSSAMIQLECCSPGGVLLDFSLVQEIDMDGLKKLAKFFSFLSQGNTRPELKHIDRFITCLKKKAEENTGTRIVWDVLFAYERFLGDRDAFEERAIKFAIHYGISPPSWE